MLLLEAVARQSEIEASDADVEGRIAELAREHRMPVKQLRKQLVENDQIDALRYNLTQDKALDFVLDKANVTEAESDRRRAREGRIRRSLTVERL